MRFAFGVSRPRGTEVAAGTWGGRAAYRCIQLASFISLILLMHLFLVSCSGGAAGGGGSVGNTATLGAGGSDSPGDTNGGGDGGGGGNIDPLAQSLEAHADALTADEAYHLLRRAAFGATPDQVARAVERGLTATVDDLLEMKPDPQYVTDLVALYENEVAKKWLVQLIEGPNPLLEKMALFWHDRFATSRRVADGRDAGLGVLHWQMLRLHALGNYRTFLQDLTIDPLMLIWLDGANSPKDNPNENYTREFWELFTLGRDVLYSEDDIREGTRAFTGITLLRESDLNARPIYDILNHDNTIKHILPDRSEPANHDYFSVIDLTLDQPEAAQYMARNLFVYFVHDYPSAATVNALAEAFVAGGFEIAPLVRQILTSQAMFSFDAMQGQVSSPVEHWVGAARTLDMHMESEDSQGYILDRVWRELAAAGMDLMNPPGVQGWSEGEAWLEDQWIINRVQALGRTMEYGPDRTPVLPMHLLPPPERWAEREIRREIVEAMAEVLHLNLLEEEIDIYVEVLDQNGWRAFHLEEPDSQPRHIFELIRLMMMHEEVITR